MDEIDSYISSQKETYTIKLLEIRNLVKALMPTTKESISYAMPVFKYKHKYLIGYAAFKNHMSLFPGSEAIEAMQDDLRGYTVSKGTIQFTEENPLSEELVKKIILICRDRIDREMKT